MTLNPVALTRRQLEALRDAAKAGRMPHGFLGTRMVTFDALAEQLLAAMDENDRLREALEPDDQLRQELETHVPPAP